MRDGEGGWGRGSSVSGKWVGDISSSHHALCEKFYLSVVESFICRGFTFCMYHFAGRLKEESKGGNHHKDL